MIIGKATHHASGDVITSLGVDGQHALDLLHGLAMAKGVSIASYQLNLIVLDPGHAVDAKGNTYQL